MTQYNNCVILNQMTSKNKLRWICTIFGQGFVKLEDRITITRTEKNKRGAENEKSNRTFSCNFFDWSPR